MSKRRSKDDRPASQPTGAEKAERAAQEAERAAAKKAKRTLIYYDRGSLVFVWLMFASGIGAVAAYKFGHHSLVPVSLLVALECALIAFSLRQLDQLPAMPNKPDDKSQFHWRLLFGSRLLPFNEGLRRTLWQAQILMITGGLLLLLAIISALYAAFMGGGTKFYNYAYILLAISIATLMLCIWKRNEAGRREALKEAYLVLGRNWPEAPERKPKEKKPGKPRPEKDRDESASEPAPTRRIEEDPLGDSFMPRRSRRSAADDDDVPTAVVGSPPAPAEEPTSPFDASSSPTMNMNSAGNEEIDRLLQQIKEAKDK